MPSWARCLPRFTRRTITYGIDAPGRGGARERRGARRLRRALRRAPAPPARRWTARRVLGPLTLQVPGRHSVLNALAAVAVGLELDVPFERDRPGARRLSRRRASLPARRRRRRHHRGRRLRSPPDRDCGGAGGRARGPARAPGRRLPAASLHAHARPDGRVRRGAGRRPTRWCSPTSTRRARIRFPASRSRRWPRRSTPTATAPVHTGPDAWASCREAVARLARAGRPGAHPRRRLDRRRRREPGGRARGAPPADGRGLTCRPSPRQRTSASAART